MKTFGYRLQSIKESGVFLTMWRFFKQYWESVLFGASCLMIAFTYGAAVGKYQIFPYEILNNAKDAALDWKKNWDKNIKLKEWNVVPSRFGGKRIVTHVPGKAYDGVTLIPSAADSTPYGVKLIGMDGSILHSWKVSYEKIWKDAAHLFHDNAQVNIMEVGDTVLYPNGDIVSIVERAGMAKLDKCGAVKWKLDYVVHHAIYMDEEGNLWTLGVKLIKKDSPYPFLTPPIEADVILKVSPDGRILREIALLDVIYKSGLHSLLFAFDPDRKSSWDVTHANDVEILEGAKAEAFPLFKKGDIMVSARSNNLVAVIDGKTEKIKWYKIGPHFRQHDPDFRENGKITMFDNQFDDKNGAVFGGSRILEIDPATRETSVVYKGDEKNPFFSPTMGAHQSLPNGNMLIIESEAGRIFEIDSSGAIVWEFVDSVSKTGAAVIRRGYRYPTHYADFAKEKCS